jgi:lipoate-protein ligase A
VLGSAQRRARSAVLQQGSLLLSDGHQRLADYLAGSAEDRRAARAALRESAGHVGDVLGPAAPLSRWADALVKVLPARVTRVDGEAAAPLTA